MKCNNQPYDGSGCFTCYLGKECPSTYTESSLDFALANDYDSYAIQIIHILKWRNN